MKWSLFSWKKPKELAPGDYQNLKNTVNTNTTSITDLRSLLTTTQNDLNNVKANYLTTNTAQTITSLKTFRAAPVGVVLKQADGRSDKQYLLFKANNDTTTFSLGSQLSETSFEANRGNIKFQTQEANKSVIFDTPLVEFNRSIPQFGTEIKAGYGAGLVKFLPEDNSTKTLQFYETNNTSQRRFKLLIGEPTEANNPATKNYVDTSTNANLNLISGLRTTTNELEYKNVFIENRINNDVPERRLYRFTNQGSTPTAYGEIYQYTLQINDLGENSIIGINVDFKQQTSAPTKAYYWNATYITFGNRNTYIKLFIDKYIYNGYSDKSVINLDFSQLDIYVFIVPRYNARENEKVYQGEVITAPEIKGGK